MNRALKIILNILIFAVVVGFGYYMIRSMSNERAIFSEEISENTFVSPYEIYTSFNVNSEVISFYVHHGTIYVGLVDRISVFYYPGDYKGDFKIEAGIRDITVDDDAIYLLYPTKIVSYSLDRQKKHEWEACSDNSDYVAITTSKDYVFVTDAANKNVVQYSKQGGLVRFIKSPNGFIIPSYTFDIININDTIFVANSGRHQIESYTLNGEFISSFGKSGSQAGAFAGCCNPVYLAATSNGNILTSEKGNPRISSYGKMGNFRMILFDSHSLGGGTDAYRMRVSGENIYIASGKTISVYEFDTTRLEKSCNKSCGSCKNACPKKMNN
jgi:hypothetical protein